MMSHTLSMRLYMIFMHGTGFSLQCLYLILHTSRRSVSINYRVLLITFATLQKLYELNFTCSKFLNLIDAINSRLKVIAICSSG